MKTTLKLALGALLCAANAATAAEAIVSTIGGIPGYVNGTGGWSFQPQANIFVTSLGCFDNVIAANSAGGPIEVGMWGADGTLLASTSVSGASALLGQSRYEPIAPLNLSPGLSYYVGAYSGSGTIILSGIDGGPGTSVVTDPLIQLGMATAGFPGFSFPSSPVGGAGSILRAPNFQFIVPEPGCLALLGLGAVAAFARRPRSAE